MDKKELCHQYKAGDKVQIIGNHNLHNFDIGETVCIIGSKEKNDSGESYWMCRDLDETQCWLVMEKDMGLVEPAKPRLAEVLGVEVGERFGLQDNGGTFWVKENGYFEIDPPQTVGSTYLLLLNAINHPESIIRAPRLTEAELERCRVYEAKWVSRDTDDGCTVDLWSKKPKMDDGIFANDYEYPLAMVNADLFPSLKYGDLIEVEEAGGDEN